MKKLSVLILLLTGVLIFPQEIEIKSLKAFTYNETSLPVISYLDEFPLTIDFDIKSDFMPNLSIVFRYCNIDWVPYENIFLQNHGQNISYDIDVIRLPGTVDEANYHFTGDYPDNYVSFPFSGKWMFYITDSHDTSVVYAEGKFYVAFTELNPVVTIDKTLLEDKSYYPLALGRVFDITTSFSIPEEMYPAFVTETEIIENHKVEYPIIIDRTFNTNVRQFYWNGDRKFSFSARDIRPGNEYRQVDLRNTNLFISKNVRAQIDGIELSRFFIEGTPDLNGGSLFTNYKNPYATYLNINFEVRPPEEITGDIFLVGSFSNWQLLPENRMKNNAGLYETTVELKRGIYDYQYITADVINDRIINENWIALEGNFWETKNEYHVFVYYNEPNYGGYKRMIGYQRVISR